jgi:hypothetical protein
MLDVADIAAAGAQDGFHDGGILDDAEFLNARRTNALTNNSGQIMSESIDLLLVMWQAAAMGTAFSLEDP